MDSENIGELGALAPAIPVSKLGASQPEVVLPDWVTSLLSLANLNVFASYLELLTCQHPVIQGVQGFQVSQVVQVSQGAQVSQVGRVVRVG